MYLSRVEINYEDRNVFRKLNHLGAFHNWVEQSFPEEIHENIRSRKLWRIDSLNGKKYLLLVSESKPNLELFEKYGKKFTAESKDYSKFISYLENGQRVKFRITLNPTVSKMGNGKSRGRVYPLLKEEDQLKYLTNRSDKHGFHLEPGEFYLLRSYFESIKKKNSEVKIVKAEFQGELTIIDKNKFVDMLVNGMGKKKAYGCGMMTVIPVV